MHPLRTLRFCVIFFALAAGTADLPIGRCADDSGCTHPTGLVLPANHVQLARAQNARVSGVLAQLDKARAAAGITAPTVIPDEWDWRNYGVGIGARNQSSCGSCWAFAITAVSEGAGAIAGMTGLDLSEQDVLCCSGAGSCNGGFFDGFNYVVKTGIAREKDYPYTARYTRCLKVPRTFRGLAWGFVDADGGIPPDDALVKAVLKGPLAVCIRADGALSNYQPGQIWSSPRGSINHAVTLIGFSKTKKAWLIKNSWGSTWGDKGYFWCKMGSNVGYGAAWLIAKPAWVSDELAAQIDSDNGCDTCTPPGPPISDWRITGPDTVDCGTLVRLTLPDVPNARVAWSHVPNEIVAQNVEIDSGKLKLLFAAPCAPGEYLFTGVVSVPDKDPEILWHRLQVGGGPTPPPGPSPDPQPKPNPEPGPEPAPVPTNLDEFGTAIRDWATDLVPDAAVRKETAPKLAQAFLSVADQVDAGTLTSLPAAMTAATAATSRALTAANREAWASFFDQVTARWQQALDAGELDTPAKIAKAARQAASGLLASTGGARQPPRSVLRQ